MSCLLFTIRQITLGNYMYNKIVEALGLTGTVLGTRNTVCTIIIIFNPLLLLFLVSQEVKIQEVKN